MPSRTGTTKLHPPAAVGYDFTQAFQFGLDLILDALEQRRTAQDTESRT